MNLRSGMGAGLGAVFILFVTALQPCCAHASDTIIVTANQERLQGGLEEGIAVFRGIPFARPPVGDLRWQAPRKSIPRQGLQSASDFAPACVQTSYNTDWYQDLITAFDGDSSEAPVPSEIAEDCLYLNVWSPDVGSDSPMPVMVFIYGGNNLGGWSYEPNYLGHNFAARGVVLVSIAYRLGVFGFFAHPELTAESGVGSSGNYGLLDQVAALEWVRRNISAFGGDKNNVTVFGESAGAANIGHLMLSPLSRGLFRNAIRQSGAFDIDYRDTLAREEAFGVEFSNSLSASTVAELRKKPAEKILDAAEKYYRSSDASPEQSRFYGAMDGYVLPDHAATLYESGKINPGNVLLGNNADESLMYTASEIPSEKLIAFIDQYFKAGAKQEVLKLVADLPSERLKIAELNDARHYSCPAQRVADAIDASASGDVYLYQFSRVRSGIGGERLGAYHGAELPYVFNTHDDWLSTEDTDAGLTRAVMDYWVNFAKTGNPNAAGLTEWPRYNAESRLSLDLGDKVQVKKAPNRSLCELLKIPQP